MADNANKWVDRKLLASDAFEDKLAEGAVASVAAWSGTAVRTTKAAYAGQTISGSYTQAEVQATDDAVKAVSQGFKALVDDLRTRGIIS